MSKWEQQSSGDGDYLARLAGNGRCWCALSGCAVQLDFQVTHLEGRCQDGMVHQIESAPTGIWAEEAAQPPRPVV